MEDEKRYTETLKAKGHINVTARHRTTLEITKEDSLTPQGDCIIAVSADKCFQDFSPDFLNALKNDEVKIVIRLECEGVTDKVTASGHPGLTFVNPHEMVVRKSEFLCERTLAIKADKAACDLNQDLVKKLKEGKTLSVVLEIK